MYLWRIIILRSGSFVPDTAGDKKTLTAGTQQSEFVLNRFCVKYHIYVASERSCEVEGGNAQQFLTDYVDQKIMTGLKM